jgi:thiol:disulfide interchange protein DsbC
MNLALPVARRMARFSWPMRTLASVTLSVLLVAGGAAFAQAAGPAPASPSESATIRKALETKFPGMEIRQVNRTPYSGLFEVVLADQIIYTDAKVGYVFVGSIFDTKDKTNLTEERNRELNRVAFDSLPLNLAMKKVRGNGQRRLAVFSDADCPYCARLEEELKSVDNVTIYTFLFPIAALHPDAPRKSTLIWCAAEPQKAWDEFFATKKLPSNKGDCANPVAEIAALGEKMNITATPTLVFADGTVVPGALPSARLETQLQKSEAELTRAAGAKK